MHLKRKTRIKKSRGINQHTGLTEPFFKQTRIRILYGYRKDYVKIKLRTLLKEYGYKRRSQNLILHIQECMEVYGLEATLRGGVPCNVAEVGIDAMLTFRVIENM